MTFHGDDGVKALAESLKHCINLNTLQLERNNIGVVSPHFKWGHPLKAVRGQSLCPKLLRHNQHRTHCGPGSIYNSIMNET